jgi:hypothetical protein
MARGFAWKDKIEAGFTNSGSRSGDKLSTPDGFALGWVRGLPLRRREASIRIRRPGER